MGNLCSPEIVTYCCIYTAYRKHVARHYTRSIHTVRVVNLSNSNFLYRTQLIMNQGKYVVVKSHQVHQEIKREFKILF